MQDLIDVTKLDAMVTTAKEDIGVTAAKAQLSIESMFNRIEADIAYDQMLLLIVM